MHLYNNYELDTASTMPNKQSSNCCPISCLLSDYEVTTKCQQETKTKRRCVIGCSNRLLMSTQVPNNAEASFIMFLLRSLEKNIGLCANISHQFFLTQLETNFV